MPENGTSSSSYEASHKMTIGLFALIVLAYTGTNHAVDLIINSILTLFSQHFASTQQRGDFVNMLGLVLTLVLAPLVASVTLRRYTKFIYSSRIWP